MLVSRASTLVQTEIAQHLQSRLAQNLVQKCMVPTQRMLMNLGIPCRL